MFFGGVCQFISGIMEFCSGNTFGATVFPSYGAFNLSYAMIYIPGTGILASCTDTSTGKLNEQFPQALAMYVWAWFYPDSHLHNCCNEVIVGFVPRSLLSRHRLASPCAVATCSTTQLCSRLAMVSALW